MQIISRKNCRILPRMGSSSAIELLADLSHWIGADRRQEQHPRVRATGYHRAGGVRPHLQPVGSQPRPYRIERRHGGCRRGAYRAAWRGHRRRRLDPHARALLRPLRPQGLSGPPAIGTGPGQAMARPGRQARHHPFGAGQHGHARRHGGLRSRRPLRPVGPGTNLPCRGGRPRWPTAHRLNLALSSKGAARSYAAVTGLRRRSTLAPPSAAPRPRPAAARTRAAARDRPHPAPPQRL